MPSARKPLELSSPSPEFTEEVGRIVGRHLKKGDLICLQGEYGTGKTILVRGLAAGVGIRDAREVSSPSFVLVHRYEGRLPLFHIDLQRPLAAEDILLEGLGEFLELGAAAIEWGDRLTSLAARPRLIIDLAHRAGGRRIRLTGMGDRGKALCKALEASPPQKN